jgi:hypothetical protein
MKKVFLFDDEVTFMKRVKFISDQVSWDVIIPEDQAVLSLLPAGYVIADVTTWVGPFIIGEQGVFTKEGSYLGRIYIYRD